MALTIKREAFACAFVETSNASEAYRRSYNAGKMSAQAIAVEASLLLKNPEVAQRVAELKQEAAERNKITVDDLLAELEEARTVANAEGKPQASAMVAATMGKAKLLGFLAERVEHSGPNGGPIPLSPTVIELVAPK